jgi:putative addiction module component (TIGR02574 family)
MAQPAINFRDLPIPERIRLVEDIWDSIADEANARPEALPLSDVQRAELRRRVAETEAHPERGIAWEVVRRELFERGG